MLTSYGLSEYPHRWLRKRVAKRGVTSSADSDSGESEEGHREDTGGDESEGHAAETAGRLGYLKLLADSGEDPEGKREAERRREAVDYGLEDIEVLLDYEDRYAEDRTVGRYQRKKDTKRLIEGRSYLLENDLEELNEERDYEDEDNCLEELESERIEDVVLEHPRDGRRQSDHERYGRSHSERRRGLLRHPEERTDTQELGQHNIVDENRRDDYRDVG